MAIPKTSSYPRMTVSEYLRFERDSETKHEFHDGLVVDMAGGSVAHALITANLSRALGNALVGKPCTAYSSDLKIWIHKRRRYLYPDHSVVCGEPTAPPEAGDEAAENAMVIFEVMSPSSARYDQAGKFRLYKDLASLREYVVLEQDEPTVDVYRPQAGGIWAVEEYSGLDAEVVLASIDVRLKVADLYAKVRFPEPGPEAVE